MACNCNYDASVSNSCKTCLNIENKTQLNIINQKRIWNQVKVPASLYLMNLASLTSAANRIKNGSNTNWNQMSDKVLASNQTTIVPTQGNSLKRTLTSNRPGASSSGGKGVDVKHDSYARYLNRKKAINFKTQPQTVKSPLYGNKTNSINLITGSGDCCT